MRRKKYTLDKRVTALCAAFAVAVAALTARLAHVQLEYSESAAAAAHREITLGFTRGMIYDRALTPLVNREGEHVAAVVSAEQTKALLQRLLKSGAAGSAAGVLYTFPGVTVTKSLWSDTAKIFSRYGEDALCEHLIGYLNGDGGGVCGIELAFDKLLRRAGGTLKATYPVNAAGDAIAAEGLQIVSEGYACKAGVVLTVDAAIQRRVQQALHDSGIKKGAAVVLRVSDSDILACASVPEFDQNAPEAALEDAALPFLNRALESYPVGSVMKPLIAAAALENGVDTETGFTCTGSIQVGDTRFRCYNGNAHGETTLETATANSCNCYFIDLGLRTGADALLRFCGACGLGAPIALCTTLASDAGNLPTPETATPAETANLSFGQGKLLASPLQLAAAYTAIANGGILRQPRLLKALVDEEQKEYAYYKNETARRVMRESTCRRLIACLTQNMRTGTGKNGASETVSAAGKTATAQTGRLKQDGSEQLCTWFCGFFPAEDPQFTVVVFNEDGKSAAADCAPVFRAITEGILADARAGASPAGK